MAKKKLGIANIEINKKFASGEEANRYAKRLISFIRYNCKKRASKGWLAQAMVVSSDLKKEVSQLRYINSGKRGRPKKELYIYERTANEWYKGNYKTDWHLHILLVSKPSYAFRNLIKDYIDNKWIKIPKVYEKEPFDINDIDKKKVYKKNCNIKMADYFINQGDKILFCDCNFSNEEKLKYSLKDYYREYLKVDGAKRKLYHQNIITPMSEEKFLQRLNKIESKFKMIENYFYNITIEEKIREEKEYMKKVQLSKIAENYNKVQNISRKKKDNNSIFERESDGY